MAIMGKGEILLNGRPRDVMDQILSVGFANEILVKGRAIDLSGDGECQEESELFHDGDVVPFPGTSVRLALDYP